MGQGRVYRILLQKCKEWVSLDKSDSLQAKRVSKGIGKRNMPLCMENEDVKDILLICPETENEECSL
jgi:hypothetical protein